MNKLYIKRNKEFRDWVIKSTLGLMLSFLFVTCYEEMPNNPIGNKPPTTKIFLVPDTSISKQPSKIRLHWTGDDPDGFVIGFYFSFDGVKWTFTNKNDSLFALQIGAIDTTYIFRVAAVDNNSNGKYDSQIIQNSINFGPEPFIDKNNNGMWDNGEFYYDIGLIDPNPASLVLPIKNSAPIISWNVLSSLPDTSFPVMSFGWNVFDLDGNETIVDIKIALNDTSDAVSLNGAVRTITIRTKEFSNNNPLMDILIDGNSNNLAPVKLPGLVFNGSNRFFVQAEDVSGAKSHWIMLPDTSRKWYVKKPKGKFLIVDNYKIVDDAADFYDAMMDSIGLNSNYDILNLQTASLPYLNTTFLETIKLYKGVIWYTDNDPSLDVANVTVPNYIEQGGKVFFSMQFPQNIDLSQIQGFLPFIEIDTSYYASTIGPNRTLGSLDSLNYPNLISSRSFARVRSFKLSNVGVTPLYYFPNGELNGYIGFESSSKNIFYIGAPLNRMNAIPGSVRNLLIKVLFGDFNLSP